MMNAFHSEKNNNYFKGNNFKSRVSVFYIVRIYLAKRKLLVQ